MKLKITRLRNMWAASNRLLAGVFGRLLRAPNYHVKFVPEVPARLAPRVLYVVREHGLCHYASMACPKSCKIVLNMNLLPDDDPVWKLSIDAGRRPTLHPSVWRTQDCGCHFWMRNGRLVWCR